jgi:small multidrug resistance family-3 protein
MPLLAWVTFFIAAVLEVGGDAVVRKGLQRGSLAVIVLGCILLGTYGVVVNTVSWDFSKMLGVYVGFFTLLSVFYGIFVFGEDIPLSTWGGCALIVAGGLLIQFGPK